METTTKIQQLEAAIVDYKEASENQASESAEAEYTDLDRALEHLGEVYADVLGDLVKVGAYTCDSGSDLSSGFADRDGFRLRDDNELANAEDVLRAARKEFER